jgi:hypothetical protein
MMSRISSGKPTELALSFAPSSSLQLQKFKMADLPYQIEMDEEGHLISSEKK